MKCNNKKGVMVMVNFVRYKRLDLPGIQEAGRDSGGV